MSKIVDTYWKTDTGYANASQLLKHIKSNKIPVTKIPLDELYNVWLFKGKTITEEIETRIYESDLSYPIFVISEGGKYVKILDGNHRYGKAYLENYDNIESYVMEYDELPDNFKELLKNKIEMSDKKYMPTYEQYINESIDSRFRAKIFVKLKDWGFKLNKDFKYSKSTLIAFSKDKAMEMKTYLENEYDVVLHELNDGTFRVNVGNINGAQGTLF